MNDYNIFTSELNNLADPRRTDLFSVIFYDSSGSPYRYSAGDANTVSVKANLPKQHNIMAKRWYFGTYRRDVINSDRGGETNLEFYLRCDPSKNIRLMTFLGVPIGEEFLDEEQRYKHVELNKQFDRIEIISRTNTFNDGEIYTLYNTNVQDISFTDLDAESTNQLKLMATVTYDTFDVKRSNESDYRSDVGGIG